MLKCVKIVLCAALVGSLLLLVSVPAGAGETQGEPRGLPQDHAYQKTLRDFLNTLLVQDFTITHKPITDAEDLDKAEDERLFRLWCRGVPTKDLAALLADPKYFTLAEIEGGSPMRCFVDPEITAAVLFFDLKGWPYRDLKALKLRTASMAMVSMLVADRWWSEGQHYRRADGLAHGLNMWAYAYPAFRDVLPAPVQKAFKAGMLRLSEEMIRYAPRDINSNMDTRELVVLAQVDKLFKEPALHARLVREARRILFGRSDRTPAMADGIKGIFHPAGYIGEKDGPETSYNGISLYHLIETAIITRGDPDWDAFMPEVIDRMLRFKAHNTFPDPDGSVTGPSNWAKRTNASYAHDQRGRRHRTLAGAMLSERGLYLLPLLPDRETMLKDLRKNIGRYNSGLDARVADGQKAKPRLAEKGAFKWPEDVNYAYDNYIPGAYKRLCALQKAKPEEFQSIFLRPEDFSHCFDQEFWVAKQGGWAFQVETVAYMGGGYDLYKGKQVGALAGGSLATFWTRETGTIIQGKLPNKWNLVTWDTVDTWPTNHLWGRDAKGRPFSSARCRRTYSYYENETAPTKVFLRGMVGEWDSPDAVEQGCEVAKVYYTRTFEKTAQGLRVTSRIRTPFDPVTVSQLWETLPVYLQNGRAKTRGLEARTKIELRIQDAWQAVAPAPLPKGKTKKGKGGATAEASQPAPAGALPGGVLHKEVSALRLTRFGHAVTVTLDKPRRVQVGTKAWNGAYQTRDRIRNIMIDLRHELGDAVVLPKETVISYLVQAGD